MDDIKFFKPVTGEKVAVRIIGGDFEKLPTHYVGKFERGKNPFISPCTKEVDCPLCAINKPVKRNFPVEE